SCQVAAGFAFGGNTRQTIGNGFAIHHQNTLVTLGDFGDVHLRHYGSLPLLGQGFEYDAHIGVILAAAEDAGSAHAIKGFENDIPVSLVELPQTLLIATDQQGWAALGKLGGKDFFVAVPQALRAINHQAARSFSRLENISAIYVFIVE